MKVILYERPTYQGRTDNFEGTPEKIVDDIMERHGLEPTGGIAQMVLSKPRLIPKAGPAARQKYIEEIALQAQRPDRGLFFYSLPRITRKEARCMTCESFLQFLSTEGYVKITG